MLLFEFVMFLMSKGESVSYFVVCLFDIID